MEPSDNQDSGQTPSSAVQPAPAAEQPSAVTPPPVSGGKKKPLIILAAVLAALLLAAGAYFMFMRGDEPAESSEQSEQTQSETEETEQAAEFSCEEGFTEFAGDNMGLHFCYPVAWGNASLEPSWEEEQNHLTSGSHKLIKFSGNSTVTAGLMSKNWEHDPDMGHGGAPGEYGKKSLAHAKEVKEFTKPAHIYEDSDKQFAYVYACGELCGSEPATVNLSYVAVIEGNDTYEVIEFVQVGDALEDDYEEGDDTIDLTPLFAKTDSRFTVLQQLANTVRG